MLVGSVQSKSCKNMETVAIVYGTTWDLALCSIQDNFIVLRVLVQSRIQNVYQMYDQRSAVRSSYFVHKDRIKNSFYEVENEYMWYKNGAKSDTSRRPATETNQPSSQVFFSLNRLNILLISQKKNLDAILDYFCQRRLEYVAPLLAL